MKYYIVLSLLIIALAYRVFRYHKFFDKKNNVSITSSSGIIKIDNNLLLFVVSCLVFFSGVKVFDKLILGLLITIVITFFKIDMVKR